MSVITPVYQVESEHKTVRNFFKTAGKYGVVLTVFGGAPVAAYVTHLPNDFATTQAHIKTSSGVSSNSGSMNTLTEKLVPNQFSYSLTPEYTKNNSFTLNGSLMEANNKMEEPDFHGEFYNENMVFDYSVDPIAKRTFKLSNKLNVVKRESTFDNQYYTDDFLQDEVISNPPPKRTFRL